MSIEENIWGGWQKLTGSFATSSWYFSRKSYQKQIDDLQLRVKQLTVDQGALFSCREENASLKKLLGAPLPSSWKFLPAKVVGNDGGLRINVGRKQGVMEGAIVVSENFLVGRVVEVREYDSRVILPIMAGAKIPVAIRSISGNGQNGEIVARGLLLGQGKLDLILDRVLQEEKIQKGDLVVSLGDSGWEPDLVIGQVGQILSQPVDIWQKAEVIPLLNYQRLKEVYVVIK